MGFSAGQVQYLDLIKKGTSKLFNEEVSWGPEGCSSDGGGGLRGRMRAARAVLTAGRRGLLLTSYGFCGSGPRLNLLESSVV